MDRNAVDDVKEWRTGGIRSVGPVYIAWIFVPSVIPVTVKQILETDRPMSVLSFCDESDKIPCSVKAA